MSNLTLAELTPLFQLPLLPARQAPWWRHAPFAQWVLAAVAPRRMIGSGEAFEGIRDLAIRRGHVLEQARDALPHVADVLVIDGMRAGMGARDDADPSHWLALPEPNAVVMIHGINSGHGGSLLWERWRSQLPPGSAFALTGGAGFGLLVTGGDATPKPLRTLCGLPPHEAASFSAACDALGTLWEAQQHQALADAGISELKHGILTEHHRVERLESATAEVRAALPAERSRRMAAERRLTELEASTTWRAVQALRRMANPLPRPVRVAMRRAARVAWWTVTGNLMAGLRARQRFLRDTALTAPVPPSPDIPISNDPPGADEARRRLLGYNLPQITLFPVTVGFAVRGMQAATAGRAVASAEVALRAIGQGGPGSILVADDGAAVELPSVMPSTVACLPLQGAGGFSAAHNRMMEAAFAAGAEVYVAADPDGVFDPDALVALLRCVRARDRAALVEAACAPASVDKPVNAGDFSTPWASCSCMAVPRQVYRRIGGFDERIGAQGADIDLSWRARAAGFAVVNAPDALFTLMPDDGSVCGTRAFGGAMSAGYVLARKWGHRALADHLADDLRTAGNPLPDIASTQIFTDPRAAPGFLETQVSPELEFWADRVGARHRVAQATETSGR